MHPHVQASQGVQMPVKAKEIFLIGTEASKVSSLNCGAAGVCIPALCVTGLAGTHVSEAPERIIQQCEDSPPISDELQTLEVSVSHTESCCHDRQIAKEAVKVNRCFPQHGKSVPYAFLDSSHSECKKDYHCKI